MTRDTEYIVSIHSLVKGLNLFQNFVELREGLKNYFGWGLMVKGLSIFGGGGQGFSRYQIKMFFHDSNLTCYLHSD